MNSANEKKEKQGKNAEDKTTPKTVRQKLQAVIQQNEEKIASLTNDLKRLQAEFENYKKLAEREHLAYQEFAEASLIKKFLPVVESFESAIDKIEKTENISKEKIIEGLKMIQKQIDDLLTKEGLQKIDCVGKQFDPMYCEAIAESTDNEKEDMVVLEEFQKGYLFRGKLLRAAKVRINKLKNDEKNDKKEEVA